MTTFSLIIVNVVTFLWVVIPGIAHCCTSASILLSATRGIPNKDAWDVNGADMGDDGADSGNFNNITLNRSNLQGTTETDVVLMQKQL